MKFFNLLLENKGTQTLNTNRLILRKFQTDDAEQMYKNWAADKEVAKYTIWKVNDNINITKEYINNWVVRYSNKDYYNWAIVTKDNYEVIGSISAFNIIYILNQCDVGYTLSKTYWNKGIATEALKEVIRFLTEEVGFRKIQAYHDINNIASGKVMKKCGMKYVKRKKQYFLSSHKPVIDCNFYLYKK